MDPIPNVMTLSNTLVHEYLIRKGHEKIARKMKKSCKIICLPEFFPKLEILIEEHRKSAQLQSAILKYLIKGKYLKTAKLFQSHYKVKDTKNTLDLHQIVSGYDLCNHLIYQYLQDQKYLKTAKKLKKFCNIRNFNTDITLQDLLQTKKPIYQVFENRLIDIDNFKHKKGEVFKVLHYIVYDSKVQVLKDQAECIEVKLRVDYDRALYPSKSSKAYAKLSKLKLGSFSRACSGGSSDEMQILKAWKELMIESKVLDEHQLIQDLNQLMAAQWPCMIIGCYVSKYLSVSRHALKVFDFLARCVLFNGGKFEVEEDNFILAHIKSLKDSTDSLDKKEYDLNFLKNHLNRPRSEIYNRILYLKQGAKIARNGQRYSTEEDLIILLHVLEGSWPRDMEHFNEISNRRIIWQCLANKLQRTTTSLVQRWLANVKPTILAHLTGALGYQWKQDFLQYLVDTKIISITDIDWKTATKRWPFCTKALMVSVTRRFRDRRGIPLYKSIKKDLHLLRPTKVSSAKLSLIEKFESIKTAFGDIKKEINVI